MAAVHRFSLATALLLAAGCYRHARDGGPVTPDSVALPATVWIPGGAFTMGDMNGEPSEYPERLVRLDPYGIDRTEVSNQAFAACVAAGVCDQGPYKEDPELGRGSHPVVGVSWFDARQFCQWVGRRLPTEAEWEFAARGRDGRKWPWSGAFDPRRANTRDPADGFTKTSPIGQFPEGASPFSILDLAGNAEEWTADIFDPTLYRREPTAENPLGPESGRDRVVRGGSWADGPHRVRAASRRSKSPTEVDDGTGFRCASAKN